MSNQLTLTVKQLHNGNNTQYSITIPTSYTVQELMSYIESEHNVSASKQRIIYRGKVLKAIDSINQYGINDGDAIHLIVRSEDQPAPSDITTSASSTSTNTTSSSSSISGGGGGTSSSAATGSMYGYPLPGGGTAFAQSFSMPIGADGMPDFSQMGNLLQQALGGIIPQAGVAFNSTAGTASTGSSHTGAGADSTSNTNPTSHVEVYAEVIDGSTGLPASSSTPNNANAPDGVSVFSLPLSVNTTRLMLNYIINQANTALQRTIIPISNINNTTLTDDITGLITVMTQYQIVNNALNTQYTTLLELLNRTSAEPNIRLEATRLSETFGPIMTRFAQITDDLGVLLDAVEQQSAANDSALVINTRRVRQHVPHSLNSMMQSMYPPQSSPYAMPYPMTHAAYYTQQPPMYGFPTQSRQYAAASQPQQSYGQPRQVTFASPAYNYAPPIATQPHTNTNQSTRRTSTTPASHRPVASDTTQAPQAVTSATQFQQMLQSQQQQITQQSQQISELTNSVNQLRNQLSAGNTNTSATTQASVPASSSTPATTQPVPSPASAPAPSASTSSGGTPPPNPLAGIMSMLGGAAANNPQIGNVMNTLMGSISNASTSPNNASGGSAASMGDMFSNMMRQFAQPQQNNNNNTSSSAAATASTAQAPSATDSNVDVSVLNDIVAVLMSELQMPDLMQLIQGSLTPLNRQQPLIRDIVMESMNDHDTGSNRQTVVDQITKQIVNMLCTTSHLQSAGVTTQLIPDRRDYIIQTFIPVVTQQIKPIIDLIIDYNSTVSSSSSSSSGATSQSNEFSTQLKPLLQSFVGVTVTELARNFTDNVTSVQKLVQHTVQQRLSSSAQAAQLAMFIPMVSSIISNLVISSYRQYNTTTTLNTNSSTNNDMPPQWRDTIQQDTAMMNSERILALSDQYYGKTDGNSTSDSKADDTD